MSLEANFCLSAGPLHDAGEAGAHASINLWHSAALKMLSSRAFGATRLLGVFRWEGAYHGSVMTPTCCRRAADNFHALLVRGGEDGGR
jgi:hypothetical protein